MPVHRLSALRGSEPEKSAYRVQVLGAGREIQVSGRRRDRIAIVARLQCGCISRAQLNAIGVTDAMIEAHESLTRVHRGVYAFGLRVGVPWAREAAALLAVPQAVAVAGTSAAALWGLPSSPIRAPVDVLVPRRRATTRVRGIRARRTCVLTRRDLRVRHGLPVTSPARTLLDLAETLTPDALERAYDELLIHDHLRTRDLAELLNRTAGRKGIGELRALLTSETEPAITDSDGERRMVALLRQAGLPRPLTRVPMHGFTVDFFWPDHKLVVELDGFPFHSTRRAFERDRRKDQTLRAAGLPPLRISGSQLKHHPTQVVAAVAAALAANR